MIWTYVVKIPVKATVTVRVRAKNPTQALDLALESQIEPCLCDRCAAVYEIGDVDDARVRMDCVQENV